MINLFYSQCEAGELFDTVMVPEGYMQRGKKALEYQREEERCIKICSAVKVKIIIHRKKTRAP